MSKDKDIWIVKTGLPPATWRILNSGNDALKKLDADKIIRDALAAKRKPPAYAALNPLPKGPHHGNRKTSPKAHGRPADGADQGAGAAASILPGAITYISNPTLGGPWTPLPPATTEPEPTPPIPYAGIRAGEIVGHRMWWVEHGHLRSITAPVEWYPGKVIEGDIEKVVDRIYKPPSPANYFNDLMVNGRSLSSYKNIYGGVYAYKTNEHFIEIRSLFFCRPCAVGTVSLWGEVIEHEEGYRAQYAKVRSIDLTVDCNLNELHARYNV